MLGLLLDWCEANLAPADYLLLVGVLGLLASFLCRPARHDSDNVDD